MKKALAFLAVIALGMWTLTFFAGDFDGEWLEKKLHMDDVVLNPVVMGQNSDAVSAQEKDGTPVGEEEKTQTELQPQSENLVDVTDGSFAFQRLSAAEQQIYNEIFISLVRYEKETNLSTLDTAVIDKVFSCVMMDHPEIFYVDGYKYTEYSSNERVKRVTFTGNYIYNKKETEDRQQQIEAVVSQLLQDAPETTDDYLLVKYVFDSIVSKTEYDMQAPDNQNICSVFLNGKSVCQGYAKAVQYLLNRLSVESTLVIGKVKQGDGHAWNLVKMNGEWYYVDATWGDAYYLLSGEGADERIRTNSINYDYLGVTTEQILATHDFDMPVDLPECTAIEDNYYVREGAYLYAYDESKIKELFANAYNSGNENVTLKCSNDEVYQEVWSQMIGQQRVFTFLQNTEGTIAYTDNEKQRSITFWL